jgi:hypothetical protein
MPQNWAADFLYLGSTRNNANFIRISSKNLKLNKNGHFKNTTLCFFSIFSHFAL